MRDFVNQTKVALAFYVERGRKALLALESENFEDFEELLKKRKAAYHNFLAADRIAVRSGYDIGQDQQMKHLVTDLRFINEELAKVASDKRKTLEDQLKKTKKVRTGLKGYKSEDSDQHGVIARGI